MIGVKDGETPAGRVGQVRPLKAQSGKGLTARPAESEANCKGNHYFQ
ncbi:hypothetical protein P8610_05705 [Fictibacillus sp. UD]